MKIKIICFSKPVGVSPAGAINFLSCVAKLGVWWKAKGLRFARAPWFGLMHTRRGESPSELSPAHRWQLSHWPSLQSFLLLRFTARKIPHPPSGCRKRSYSLWIRRHKKQRGDCGAGGGCGLRASVPGRRRQHPRELRAEPGPALPAHSPAGLPSPTLQGV